MLASIFWQSPSLKGAVSLAALFGFCRLIYALGWPGCGVNGTGRLPAIESRYNPKFPTTCGDSDERRQPIRDLHGSVSHSLCCTSLTSWSHSDQGVRNEVPTIRSKYPSTLTGASPRCLRHNSAHASVAGKMKSATASRFSSR